MEADVSILAYLLVTVAVFGVLGFVQRMAERL
ncbi:potassium-transporting ATPase [Nocardia flavorosea]|uniref:Potassium-transporting ATPase n=1 Tax=Nocardia flavorosea TaxID=53429 RepID=A0A846YCX1_9NOCA|nr:potassium-transporting ATPase [Nocardia flavorosea]NKY57446.1 potassium-transporting ATPase [Nocardia flavorosea]